jgi:hypothetical protein
MSVFESAFPGASMVPEHMDQTARNDIAIAFGSIAVEAGRAIMAVRGSAAGVRHKPDGSLVTQADIDADRIICARLASMLPDVPADAWCGSMVCRSDTANAKPVSGTSPSSPGARGIAAIRIVRAPWCGV